jgi:hypothetical protein
MIGPDQQTIRPWYREVSFWLLMLPPAFAMLGGFTMLALAVTGQNDLSVADYSRIEELTNERFARDRAAVQAGAQARIEFTQGTDGIVTIETALAVDGPAPDALVLHLQHAANSSADRNVVLERAAGRYRGIAMLPAGHYALELLPPDASWRLGGQLPRVPSSVVLEPSIGAHGDR